jgi:hypothetical protein
MHSDSGMDPLTIAVAFDIGEQVAPRGVAIEVLALMDELGLQCAEETLDGRIVPAVCLATYRLDDGSGVQDIAVVAGSVLTTAVGMMDKTRSRAPPLDRYGERDEDEFGAHMVAYGPADHLAGVYSRST